MTVMIDNWIAECDQCQREGKTLGTVAPLQTIKVSAVWELLGIDLTGPFPKTTDGYQALMKLVNEQQNNWDTFLDATLFSLRSKVHISTKHTPFQLMYGREAVFPSEVPVDYPDTLLWRAASGILEKVDA
uniref:Uncharacterized protein n=1 Tax=Knipowitschia caucasica TaxID=637954 RepID=A0AAV2LCI4_KNICA